MSRQTFLPKGWSGGGVPPSSPKSARCCTGTAASPAHTWPASSSRRPGEMTSARRELRNFTLGPAEGRHQHEDAAITGDPQERDVPIVGRPRWEDIIGRTAGEVLRPRAGADLLYVDMEFVFLFAVPLECHSIAVRRERGRTRVSWPGHQRNRVEDPRGVFAQAATSNALRPRRGQFP